MHRPFLLFTVLLLLVPPLRGAEAPPADAAVSVDALVAQIIDGNPELDYYRAEIAAARAGRRTAGAWQDPELSVEIGRKRVRDAVGQLAGEGTTWAVSVVQPFDWPGRLSLRKAIANRQVELAELGLAQFEAALRARAQTLAFGLHAAHLKSVAVREVADRFAALKETYLARDPAGVTPRLEVRVIEATELALQRRAIAAELELQASLMEMNQLRGQPAHTPLRVVTQPVRWTAELPAFDALLAAARQHNFTLRLRQVELEQQGAMVRLARHERLPTLSVAPFYSQEQAAERETVVGLGFNLPLPVTPRSRGAVDTAEARQRQADAARLVAERELERDVLTAAQALTAKVGEMRRWPEEPIREFREAAELADRHYRLGAVPLSTYVELQSAYLEAVEALLATEQEALEAGLRLQLLTGLDLERFQPSAP